MKFDKEMVKGALEVYLEKEGFTLQEFEEYLQSGVEKKADDDKKKSTKIVPISGITGAAVGAGKIVGGIAGLIGGMAGIGAYGAYDRYKDSDKKILKHKETIRKIDAATRELKSIKAQQRLGLNGL